MLLESVKMMEPPSGAHSADEQVLSSEPTPVAESANPGVPLKEPAISAVCPVKVDSRRMRLPLISATASAPEGCSATPVGLCKAADVPTPAENALVPLPARVVARPVEVLTTRTRWFVRSATKRAPPSALRASM